MKGMEIEKVKEVVFLFMSSVIHKESDCSVLNEL